jgi:hypothetical protein
MHEPSHACRSDAQVWPRFWPRRSRVIPCFTPGPFRAFKYRRGDWGIAKTVGARGAGAGELRGTPRHRGGGGRLLGDAFRRRGHPLPSDSARPSGDGGEHPWGLGRGQSRSLTGQDQGALHNRSSQCVPMRRPHLAMDPGPRIRDGDDQRRETAPGLTRPKNGQDRDGGLDATQPTCLLGRAAGSKGRGSGAGRGAVRSIKLQA